MTPCQGSTTRNQASIGHIFGAAGLLYGLGSARVGHHSWELGLLSSSSVGVAKLLNIGSMYFGFGFAAVSGSELGFYASSGVEFWNLAFLNFRFEANGIATYRNTTEGELLLGVSLNF